MTNRFLDGFETNATGAANNFMGDLEQELENRFSHQDSILTNMSTLVGKFQETLKVLGKDGWNECLILREKILINIL